MSMFNRSFTFGAVFNLLKKKPLVFFLFTFLLLTVMHIHVFNRDLVGVHVWRQTQTQINIENFANTDFNILNPKSYSLHNKEFLARYEFPFMQWVFAIFYKAFGNYIIISRVLTFLISIFSAIGIYRLLSVLFKNQNIPFFGTWAFCFSPVFYYYMVNPLPDNFALCMGIWSLYYFFRYTLTNTTTSMLLSFLFLSLSVLNKLPFILYATPWFIYMISNLKTNPKLTLYKSICLIVFMLPAAVWYINVIPGWAGNGITTGIAGSQNTELMELLNIMQSNLFSTLPELLINYGSLAFFIAGLFFFFKLKLYKNKNGMYLSSLGAVLIAYFLFEMNMIGTVHDYYLFPFLPLLFILVGFGVEKTMSLNTKTIKYISVFLLLILPVTAFLRINERWNTTTPGFNKDLLIFKYELRNAVPDDACCISGNDKSAHIWPYYLHKKSWSFSEDTVSEETFNYYCTEGAKYLYSDSRQIESIPFIKARIKRLVIEKGSIRVFELSQ